MKLNKNLAYVLCGMAGASVLSIVRNIGYDEGRDYEIKKLENSLCPTVMNDDLDEVYFECPEEGKHNALVKNSKTGKLELIKVVGNV